MEGEKRVPEGLGPFGGHRKLTIRDESMHRCCSGWTASGGSGGAETVSGPPRRATDVESRPKAAYLGVLRRLLSSARARLAGGGRLPAVSTQQLAGTIERAQGRFEAGRSVSESELWRRNVNEMIAPGGSAGAVPPGW